MTDLQSQWLILAIAWGVLALLWLILAIAWGALYLERRRRRRHLEAALAMITSAGEAAQRDRAARATRDPPA